MQAPAPRWAFTTTYWLVALAAAASAIARVRRPLAPGAAGLAACGAAGAVAVCVSLIVPARQIAGAPQGPHRVSCADDAALRLRPQPRPLALYDPLVTVPWSAIPPLLAFVTAPRPRGELTGAGLLTTRDRRCPPATTSYASMDAGAQCRARWAGRAGAGCRRRGPGRCDGDALDHDARPAGERALRRLPRLAGAGGAAPELTLIPHTGRRPAHPAERYRPPAEPAIRRRRGVFLDGRVASDRRLLDPRRQREPADVALAPDRPTRCACTRPPVR